MNSRKYSTAKEKKKQKSKLMNKPFLYLVFLALLAYSCSNLKYLPEGELLYVKGKVKVEDSAISRKQYRELKTNLNEILRPKPNKKILGLRVRLYLYNIAGEVKKEKGIRYWLKYKVGEAPVLFSKVDMEYNKSLVQNYAENHGYFNAKTSGDSTRIGKKATAEYFIDPRQQYRIKSVTFPTDSIPVDIAVSKTQRRSLLKVGDPYSLELIKEERVRIDTRLKERGFYYFDDEYLKVQVDSTVGKHEVDLIVKVKSDTPLLAKKAFKINKINIYPNYSINVDTLNGVEKYKDFTIYGNNGLFKPQIFDRTLLFKKGDYYNRTKHNLSLNRLVTLGTFKFVKNQFRISDTIGDYLDAYYYLTPLTKKSIRLETLVKTNSANYTGTELSVNWTHRNAFRGAEALAISVFGGVEVQLGGKKEGFNVFRYGGETSLTWPRIIAPFQFSSGSGFVPKTKATLGYEFQNRVKLYTLQTFKASFGYSWKENIRKQHDLNVTEISFVSPENITDLYNEEVRLNSALKHVIEKQLIFGPTYSYTYTNMMQKRRKNNIFNKASLDLSGNIVGLVTGANIRKGDTIKIFDIPFSQFVKVQNEFKHYRKLSENSQLCSRLIVGAAFPYGNSNQIPFIKQFFIGGTNSLRAFRSRSIGPGSYDATTEDSEFIPDQSGDIKLEINSEYRTKIYRVVNGAIFIDAGNIWLVNEDAEKPGAKFSKDFLNELAVGVGVGLRFDFNFLVLRTDLAFPIRKPYLPVGNRWVLDQINFGNRDWRRENLIFNLAIGYPF
jgi:outer membrane protein insertion porin family